MEDETKGPPTTGAAPAPTTDLPISGGFVFPVAPLVPSGGITLGADADVADALKNGEPTFGLVLEAVGAAAADTQKKLDDAAINAINIVNQTTIDVITGVEIELDPATGLPFGDDQHTRLVKNTVSLAQFYTPRPPMLKRIDTSMDLVVGRFHSSQGVQFASKQSNTSIAGGLSWNKSFGGWFSASTSQSKQSVDIGNRADAEFISGQLLIDVEFGARALTAPPAAVQITVGPRILIMQGKITETTTNNVVTSRQVDIEVQVRKASGEINPNVGVVLDAQGLAGGGGKQTDANGKITYQLKRDLPAGTTGFRQFALNFRLGDLQSPYALTL